MGAQNNQSKKWSLIEALSNTLFSFGISVYIQWAIFPYFGIHVSLSTNISLVLIFMAVSVVRGYFFRRFFNWLLTR